MKVSLFVLGIAATLGAIEGVLEEYLKFMDKRNSEAPVDENQSEEQQPTSFWTKQRILRFNYKCWRLLVIIIILTVSFLSLLNVIMAIMNGGLGSIDWKYVVLMPSFKIYKAFTKVMSDVINDTDEAANDASKVYSGYNTALGLYESLKSLQSSTTETETEKETKNSTENKDDKTQYQILKYLLFRPSEVISF